MSAQVVTYEVDGSTHVSFEIEPGPGFRPAGGTKEVLGRVQEAVAPAIEAAKAVLDKVKEVGPDQVELRFGVKVSGGANWLVAKAAGEGNFEITLTWDRRSARAQADSQTALGVMRQTVTAEVGEPADMLADDQSRSDSLPSTD